MGNATSTSSTSKSKPGIKHQLSSMISKNRRKRNDRAKAYLSQSSKTETCTCYDNYDNFLVFEEQLRSYSECRRFALEFADQHATRKSCSSKKAIASDCDDDLSMPQIPIKGRDGKYIMPRQA